MPVIKPRKRRGSARTVVDWYTVRRVCVDSVEAKSRRRYVDSGAGKE